MFSRMFFFSIIDTYTGVDCLCTNWQCKMSNSFNKKLCFDGHRQLYNFSNSKRNEISRL